MGERTRAAEARQKLLESFGLSEDLGMSMSDAKKFIDNYLETYPGIKDYMEKLKNDAYKNGFVKTLFGARVIIACEPSDIIIKIKEMIQEQIDLPADGQRLIHKGKQLEDDKTLSDYNIKTLSIFHIAQRLI